ncbi:hypothetical protein [Planosporangium mesophilum]|uniref:Anti-sigma-D factor RsdA sigma factor binding region domain-containing protein n=1 Tax=Planosporangium mesophilum TaxID=689768 RepID=A0A8J3X2Z6_9ACTN|nr:hypothetical protein [Planosporangium mesophilum]NJC86671.1 hypothetical protein [Planosporangium mesophilum]GII25431.1 hypothetical protein Pme01_50280 [Planosporangium mesophilum]
MTDGPLTSGERPTDLADVVADTLLLDALGSGGTVPATDRAAWMLAAWRDDLAAGLDELAAQPLPVGTAVVAQPEAEPAGEPTELLPVVALPEPAPGVAPPWHVGADVEPATPHDEAADALVGADPRPGRRSRRVVNWTLGSAAALLVAGTGIVIGAGHATPGSPLWPITRAMYPEQADAADTEHTLALARLAASDGRYDEARRLLKRAETLLGRVDDPSRARRLREEMATVTGMLPQGAAVSTPSATSTPDPAGPADPSPTAPAEAPVPRSTTVPPGPKRPGGPPGPGVPIPIPTVTVTPSPPHVPSPTTQPSPDPDPSVPPVTLPSPPL